MNRQRSHTGNPTGNRAWAPPRGLGGRVPKSQKSADFECFCCFEGSRGILRSVAPCMQILSSFHREKWSFVTKPVILGRILACQNLDIVSWQHRIVSWPHRMCLGHTECVLATHNVAWPHCCLARLWPGHIVAWRDCGLARLWPGHTVAWPHCGLSTL